jgi:hypothetical protein
MSHTPAGEAAPRRNNTPTTPTGQTQKPASTGEYVYSLPPARKKHVDLLGAILDALKVLQVLSDIDISCLYKQTISDIRNFRCKKKWINFITRKLAKESTSTTRILIAIFNGENELLQHDLNIADARLGEVAELKLRRTVHGRKIADNWTQFMRDTRQEIAALLDRDGYCTVRLKSLENDGGSAATILAQIYRQEIDTVRDDLAAAYRRLLLCCDMGNEVSLGFWNWRWITTEMKKLARIERGRTVDGVGDWQVTQIAEALALAILGVLVVCILDVKSMTL